MKKLIFIICSLLIKLAANAQTKQLWGMTYQGGTYGVGSYNWDWKGGLSSVRALMHTLIFSQLHKQN